MKSTMLVLALVALVGCGARQEPKGGALESGSDDPQKITYVEYAAKTQKLLETNRKLNDLRGQLDDQRRRLAAICVDHPDHEVCRPQTEAMYARRAFCEDEEFTRHVDSVVNACHEGECKQLDQAEQISRSQYMMLTQRLPNSLVLFRAGRTKLDRGDRAQLQQFLENLRGERGYVIIVGRASRDGDWRQNIRLALDRAQHTREYLVRDLGVDPTRVGFITYGHDKMYLTALDAERLSDEDLSVKQANRSALVFSYPCYEGADVAF